MGNETILLVDDDEAIRHSGKKRLEKAGYTVLAASDGETALEIYGRKADKDHLVLLDLIMPGMGGVRCLRELLRIDPDVKVIIISGHYPDDQSGHAIEACACTCLRKPYTDESLLNTIHMVLIGNVAGLSQSPPDPANRSNHQTC